MLLEQRFSAEAGWPRLLINLAAKASQFSLHKWGQKCAERAVFDELIDA
jgi:hypothetical protein